MKTDETNLTSIAKTFSLDRITLKTEWTLLVNDHVSYATKPNKILQQLAEKKIDVYIELTSLLRMLCTIPFTSANCERSLKIILRSKLRTTMTQERMAGLLLPFIEQHLLQE